MIYKLLFTLFAALACVVDAGSTSPCSRGLSYWCENYSQAKECDALILCQESVWKPRIGTDSSAICHASVKAMYDHVKTSVTQQQFRKALRGLCSQLHSNSDECMSLIRDNDLFLFQQLKKLLANSKLLCKGCLPARESYEQTNKTKENNKVISGLIRDMVEHFSTNQGDVCINCQLIVTQVSKLLRNGVTLEIVLNMLERSCGLVQTLHEQCKAFVDTYVNIFFTSVVDTCMTPAEKPCRSLSLCENSETLKDMNVEGSGEAIPVNSKTPKDIHDLSFSERRPTSVMAIIDVCRQCVKVVTIIERFLKLNETERAIKRVVIGVCTLLAAENEIKCIAVVNHYGNQIIEKLAFYQSPSFLCKALLNCAPRVTTIPKSKKQISCYGCSPFEKSIAEFLPYRRSKKFVQRSATRICKDLVDVQKIQPQKLCSSQLARSLRQDKTVCGICKTVVAYLEGFFKINQTMKITGQIVIQMCSILPVDQEILCGEKVAQYAKNIVTMVHQKLRPTEICRSIFLCPRSRPSTLQNGNENKKCDNCNQVVAYLEGIFKFNKSMAYLRIVIVTVCRILPDEQQNKCQETTSHYAANIIAMVQLNLKPINVCKMVHQCRSSKPVGMRILDNNVCETCKAYVAYLEGAIKMNRSLATDKVIAVQACGILPDNQQAQCKDKISLYADSIIKMIKLNLKPFAVCKMLHFCRAINQPISRAIAIEEDNNCDSCKQAVVSIEEALKISSILQTVMETAIAMCSVLPIQQEIKCKETVNQYAEQIIMMIQMKMKPTEICDTLSLCPPNLRVKNMKTFVKDDTNCETCQRVVTFVEQTFKINKTMAAMMFAVVQVCTILPAKQEIECTKNVAQYAQNIITMIGQKIRPVALCKTLALCSLARSLSLKPPTNHVVCDTCKNVVAYLEGAFKVNQTMEAMKLVVLQACSILLVEQKDECHTKVIQHAQNMMKMIQIRMKPSIICDILFLCPPGHACSMCQQAVGFVEGAFQVNQSVAALKLIVVQMCSILPIDQKSQCKAIVGKYADNFITLIQLRVKPSTICKTFYFCGANQRLKQLTQYNSGPNCGLCRVAVYQADQVYGKERNEKELMSAMVTMCLAFSKDHKVKCNKMVKVYGRNIMDKLRRSQSPAIICQTMDLCANDRKWRQSGCHNGQQYWCASFSNASKCKALKYCNHIHI